ncbi:intraflagellar transport protein 88 homolog [Sitodiplosis mosellana]|uniref:intraflagellar transport protein 88 homolog n=1 Tax=Sitodiplosis mosellana TaxID=263140 RepID=UPI002444F55A|nr:intraflagellar transport protein 88 homolog [Sitodiplosis mosellana]
MDDDLYNGFQSSFMQNYENSRTDIDYENTQKLSSYGKKKNTPKLLSREAAATALSSSTLARPITGMRPVGYTSEAGRQYDPFLNQRQAIKKTISLDVRRPEEQPEEKYKGLEKKILFILEESILESTSTKDLNLSSALNKAKEAFSYDRTLLKLRDQNGDSSYHNSDITFAVLFNLANIYAKSKMYVEALNTYAMMTKNKMFLNVNRLKLNMGNIYFQLGHFSKAIKMYRMALDQVPSNQKELRLKISHNIGILFIKMGQYSDAATSFEFIMSEQRADLKSGLHLILCYYVLGDIEKMKRGFQHLLDVPIEMNDDHRISNLMSNPSHQYVIDFIKNDKLAIHENRQKHLAKKNILMSANLISSIIEENFNDGYTWCVEMIKSSHFAVLANELELNKAIMYLKQHDVHQAIETLKYYEKKEPAIAANATISLTFIYIKMKDVANALKYAEISRDIDSYNPAGFVNSGTCEFIRVNYNAAQRYFEMALEIDPTAFEALYNLGLVHKKTGDFENALSCFHKISATVSNNHHPHVIFQMGNLYELLNDTSGAIECYTKLLGLVNTDPSIFQKISNMYEIDGDRQTSFQYQNEAYQTFPCNLQTISWIGSHFIDLQVAENAITYYEKAVLATPNSPHFLLRIAGCLRRIGNSQKSLNLFQDILKQFPENADCYKALLHLTQTLNMDDLYQKYYNEYQRIEKLRETRQRIGSSRPTTNSSQRNRRGSDKLMHAMLGNSSVENAHSSSTPSRNSDKNENNMANVCGDPLTSSYADPLGPMAERPRTGKLRNSVKEESDEDFDAEELLPI